MSRSFSPTHDHEWFTDIVTLCSSKRERASERHVWIRCVTKSQCPARMIFIFPSSLSLVVVGCRFTSFQFFSHFQRAFLFFFSLLPELSSVLFLCADDEWKTCASEIGRRESEREPRISTITARAEETRNTTERRDSLRVHAEVAACLHLLAQQSTLLH